MLSDHDIHRYVRNEWVMIHPFIPENVQPSSIDLRLDRHFMQYASYRMPESKIIDVKSSQSRMTKNEADYFILKPQGFILASTCEYIELPDYMGGRVEGKSSLGRMGLFVHATAGFIDPGFRGYITLELFNAAPFPIKLYADMKICQLSLHRLESPAQQPYGKAGSKYQDAPRGPQESRYWKNFDDGT